jgi:polyhydroxybutyrate depolymerase
MTKKLIVFLSILTLFLTSSIISANASVKAGSACKKAGITSTVSSKTYTCIKSGKKLVWNKGKQTSSAANAGEADDKLLYAGIKYPVPTKGWLTSLPLPTKEDSFRSYTIYIPSTWTPNVVSPLLIALHGLSGWDLQLMDNTAFNNLAEANNFIVVYPNGTGEKLGDRGIRSWNGGQVGWCTTGNCPPSQISKIDDVGYISNLIDDVSSRYPIDPKRVYLTGHSNGSQLAQRLACQLSNKITAVAVVAGHLALDTCNPDSPVSLLQIYGTEDTLNLENGGTVKISFGIYSYEFNSKGVMKSVQEMALANGCSSNYSQNNNLTNKDLTIYTWPGCKNGVIVSSIRISGASHAWMGRPAQSADSIKLSGEPYMKIDASKVIWSFLANKVKN